MLRKLRNQIRLAGLTGILSLFAVNTVFAQFTNGNIVVLQVGDGSGSLSSAATASFLQEYNTTTANQTVPLYSVPLPTTGAARLTNAGSSTSEGYISRSADSLRLVVAGYDAATGTASVAGTASATVNRVVDTVNAAGAVGRAASTATQFTGGNIRSAYSANGDNYWASGSNTGTYYLGNTATPAVVQSVNANTRVLKGYNGNLYYTSASAGTFGLNRISGYPTSSSTPTLLVNTATGSSPYGFAVNDAETVVYIADDRTNGSGGIQKWVLGLVGWAHAYTLSVGTNIGARGLEVDFSGTDPVLYATTTDNKLVKITDNGSAAAFTVLATAPANTAFRGVAFAPKVMLNCVPPTLTSVSTDVTCGNTADGTISLGVSGGSGPFTYSWTGPGGYTATTENITGLAPSIYTVVVNGGGCTATLTDTINAPVTLSVSTTPMGSTQFCEGDSLTLTATATGSNISYTWLMDGAPVNNATGNTLVVTEDGTYETIVTAPGSCPDTSAAIVVTTNPAPVFTVAPSGALGICAGDSAIFDADYDPAYSYQWYMNGMPLSNADSSSLVAAAAGSYYVVVTDTNTSCAATGDTIALTVNPLPVPVISVISVGGVQTVTTNTPFNSYQWYYNNQIVVDSTSQYMATIGQGNYYVVVTDSNGCSDTSNVLSIFLDVTDVDAAAISVYPNPAQDLLHVMAPATVNVTIADMQGRVLIQERSGKILLKGLASGMYVITITRTDGALLRAEKLIIR